VRESTRLLFTRARESARLARSLERQAAKLALNAQREYEHGKHLFLKACAELEAADEAEGSASAGRAHVPRSPAGGLGIASGARSKESPRGGSLARSSSKEQPGNPPEPERR
jgi:hypothetical protein